jgi:hypothetical protein
MNKIFTKKNRIELDDYWYIESDGGNGIQLVFHEPRKRTKKGTDVEENYIFEDVFYFNRVVQALKHYCNKTQNSSKDLKDILEKTDKIYNILEKLDKEFRQFN